MSPFFAIFLVLLLASSSYAAGRLHGQLSYRLGYRFGYRQGYFDGDRAAWNRRRRDAQAAVASVISAPRHGPEPAGDHITEPLLPHGSAGRVEPVQPPGVPDGPAEETDTPADDAAGSTGASGDRPGANRVTPDVGAQPRRRPAAPAPNRGTTYTASTFAGSVTNSGRHAGRA